VGSVFFVGISLSAFSVKFLAKRFGCRNPSSLGTAMILFGLFYLLSPIVIPAYMQAQTAPIPHIPMDMGEIVLSFALMAVLGIIGFAGHRYRRSND
jgi:predicted transporter